MRKFLLGFFIIAFAVACNVRADEAAAYNDELITHQIEVIEAFDAMDTTLNNYIPEEMDYALLQLESCVARAQRSLMEIGPFKNDSGLFLAANDLFGFYKSVSTKEYYEIVDLLKIPDTLYTIDHQARAAELEQIIFDDFEEAHRAFLIRQKSFAQQYNVEIVDLEDE